MSIFLGLAWRCLTSRLGLSVIGIGAALAALTLAVNLGKANGTIRALKKDLVTTNEAWGKCRSDLTVQQAQNLELRGKIDVQNAEIQEWKRKGDAIQAEADRKLAKARREAADYRAQVRRVMAAKPQGQDRCKAASQLYLDSFGAGQ